MDFWRRTLGHSGAKQLAEKYQVRQQSPLRQQVGNQRLEPNLENSLSTTKNPKMSFSANCKALIPVARTEPSSHFYEYRDCGDLRRHRKDS
jgi:hypothetical protein